MLRPYRLLAAVPNATSLMVCSLLGRLHMPAIAMVMSFLIADWTGSYATGGVLGAALTIGQGIAGPLRGRAADRSSAPKLLLATGALYGVGLVVIALLARPGGPLDPELWWVLLPLCMLTGLAHPPVTQVGRAIWPRISRGPAREAAYAVEATMQELLFVVTPVLAASAVAFWNPVVATLLCAVASAVGPAVFAAALWRAGLRDAPIRAEGGGGASLFRLPGFVPMLAFSALIVGGLVSVDLVLVGWSRERGTPELAGILAAVWAVGSLVGGLLVGGVTGRPRLWLRALLAALGLVALVPALPPLAEPASPWLVGVILFAGGTAIAPTLAAVNGRLAEIAPEERRSEAFGWFSTATTTGVAVASPVAGSMLDTAGPAAAAAAAGTAALMSVLLVARHSVRGSRVPRVAEETAPT
ncbi:MFS transporter [Saccharopolyspora erythraea]|uniref:MFS transporter n=1 Tax=Saccharopolyspora erythraea TaxID=1836 RepID=UPI001BA74F22|nr:MFS transporter [Saccharopolyspora erythraea]QUH05038.1 MFS transporter [Saccharopolyspora erythraea]